MRTGVTVIVPSEADVGAEQLFAGCHTLNGNGELTGLEWVRESGRLTTPIAITNTHSVGVVRDALVAHSVRGARGRRFSWALPVVGETWDGMLNDINGQHVRREHVDEALAKASGGPVEEGAVGGGTGMICHGFKGGIGTASRVIAREHGGYTVGVLVQANHGWRERLAVAGAPVGRVDRARRGARPVRGAAGHRGGRGLDHRDRRHRRAAAAAPVPAARPAGVARHRPHRRRPASTRAATSCSPSRPRARACRRARSRTTRSPSPCRSRCSWTPTSTRSTTRRSRPRRPRSSTRCWPPRRRPGGAGVTAYGLEPELLLEAMGRFGRGARRPARPWWRRGPCRCRRRRAGRAGRSSRR